MRKKRKPIPGQPDLFSYPNRTGFKEKGGTSQKAADEVESSGRRIVVEDKILQFFATGSAGTADQIARAIGEDTLSVRPTLTLLSKRHAVLKTKERRTSDRGKSMAVWRKA
jgi:hypothetical protein